MDLSSLSQRADTAQIEIYHPETGETLTDDDGQPMWVEVYGVDSPRYREIDQRITDRNLKKAFRGGRNNAVTADQLVAQEWERLTHCVKAWHIVFSGEVPACEPGRVREVFEAVPWLREQVESGMKDRSRFFGS